MDILDISIIVFSILESSNVIILYLHPDSKKGNGVAVFNAWFKSKDDDSFRLFSQYMKNWVAGSKLIFIVLLMACLFTGTETTKIFAVIAVILSIGTYYWHLHPIISKLDDMGEITPKGYSKTLFKMITVFIVMFSIALIVHFIK